MSYIGISFPSPGYSSDLTLCLSLSRIEFIHVVCAHKKAYLQHTLPRLHTVHTQNPLNPTHSVSMYYMDGPISIWFTGLYMYHRFLKYFWNDHYEIFCKVPCPMIPRMLSCVCLCAFWWSEMFLVYYTSVQYSFCQRVITDQRPMLLVGIF